MIVWKKPCYANEHGMLQWQCVSTDDRYLILFYPHRKEYRGYRMEPDGRKKKLCTSETAWDVKSTLSSYDLTHDGDTKCTSLCVTKKADPEPAVKGLAAFMQFVNSEEKDHGKTCTVN